MRHACHVNPQCWHVVGLRPASSARSPGGKKQIATMITHTGNPFRMVIVAHFGQETFMVFSPNQSLVQ
jgi:hypothetical protein